MNSRSVCSSRFLELLGFDDGAMGLDLAAMSKLTPWIQTTRIAFGQSLLETGFSVPDPPPPSPGTGLQSTVLTILEHMGSEAAPGPSVGRRSPGLGVNGPGKDGWVTEAGVRIGVGQY